MNNLCNSCRYLDIKCSTCTHSDRNNWAPDLEINNKGNWYLIKLNRIEEIESQLPPSRCVFVENLTGSPKFFGVNLSWIDIELSDIEIKSYKIGGLYEFSDDGEHWVKQAFCGYTWLRRPHLFSSDKALWRFMRVPQKPVIKVLKDNVSIELTEEILDCLRSVIG